MALSAKSLFLFGFQITEFNRSIDFKGLITDSSARQATLNLGFYSLTSLAQEISRAMQAVDPARLYTVTVNRNVAGGLQNRITISSNGSFFQLLFGSGPRAASSVAPLIGFPAIDQTGATFYTSSNSAGTVLVPTQIGYNFLSPEQMRRLFGTTNVSSSGLKEAVVFNIQQFWQAEFRFEPKTKINTEWAAFMTWAIQQRRLEFTPEISSPNVFYEGTLERSEEDGKGLAYRFPEMLPDFPNNYRTGLLVFRQSNQ